MARQAILDDLAQALGWSLTRVRNTLAEAQTVRHLAPLCWFAWARGEYGSGTVRLLAEAVNQLRRESSAEVLDSRAVGWLPGRTPTEVRAWLARQVHRLEPEESAEDLKRVEADRRVRVTHRGDGMSEFWALLPTRHAAAIEKNLRRVRAAKPAADPRSRAQWEADHVVDQLLCDPTTGEGVQVTLGILIPVTALAGVSDEPGVSVDRAWDLPAELVRDLANCKGTIFERVVTDPLGNVLDVTRLGYEFSRAQKHAMEVRDGTCCFPGCQAPAEFCDTDHVIPYGQGGATAGWNGKNRCRRHHGMKGFGVLPTPYDGPPDPVRRQIAAAFAGRTQDIDLEPITIPWSAFGWRRPEEPQLEEVCPQA